MSTPQLRISLAGHDLSRTVFRRRPALTADALLRSVVSEDRHVLPHRLRTVLLTALGHEGRAAYRLLTGRRGMFCPTVVIPDVTNRPSWTLECADAIANADVALLHHALDEAFDDEAPQLWRQVLDDPTKWLHDLAAGMRRAGPIIEAVWKHGQPELDEHEARVEIATAASGGPSRLPRHRFRTGGHDRSGAADALAPRPGHGLRR